MEDLKTKLSTYSDKQYRSSDELASVQQELALVQRSFKNLQSDLTRLHTVLSQNRGKHDTLMQQTLDLETDFVKGLKQQELEMIQMAAKNGALEEARDQLQNAVVEAETQIHLWEKKIQLAKVSLLFVCFI